MSKLVILETPVAIRLVKVVIIVVAVSVFYLIKGLIKKMTSKEVVLTEEEKNIFSIQLDVRKREGWIERIDYWIEQKNYEEALKLTNVYIKYNSDNLEEFFVRKNRIIDLIAEQEKN